VLLTVNQGLFEDWQSIPPEHLTEACQKACEFIDCGQVDDSPNKPKPRLMDWEQDGDMIVPAVNKVTGKEIRAVPYIHWWTFFGYFMESGECLFNTVVGIRSKKAKGEKLDIEGMTSINTWRTVLNTYFGTDYEMLPAPEGFKASTGF